MKVTEAAFVRLVLVARADGMITGDELGLLGRYRRALHIESGFAQRVMRRASLEPLLDQEVDATPIERRHVLKMMVRVALHDGRLESAEHDLLEHFAESFGISKIEFADIVVTVEHDSQTRHGLRRRTWIGIGVVAIALIIAWIIQLEIQHTAGRQSAQEQSLSDLRLDLDERAELLALSSAAEPLVAREEMLENMIRELEPKTSDEEGEPLRRLLEELAELKAELTALERRSTAFQRIEQEWNESVLLIWVMFDMVRGSEKLRRGASGSGFFVTPDGLIATAKHVAEPWKFRPSEASLIAQGYRLDPDSIDIAAWPAGSRVRLDDGKYNWNDAYGTWNGKLRSIAVGPDRFETMMRIDTDTGEQVTARFHVYDMSDVALLKADVATPVACPTLQPDIAAIGKLDPVMLLGYPRTFSLFETERVETAPSLGQVRKVENRIFTTAPTIGGNSGGPLFDDEGRVIGLASTSHGASTLGGSVPVKYVLELLPSGTDLLESAKRMQQSGHDRAALDLLLLAEQKGAPFTDVQGLRLPLIAKRDAWLREAKTMLEGGKAKECRSQLSQLVQRYGSRWGAEASRLLEELR
ncbi:MAG: trypsin-like peptidase domain-containing protein [Planctomycetota bacterium]